MIIERSDLNHVAISLETNVILIEAVVHNEYMNLGHKKYLAIEGRLQCRPI